MQVNVVATPPKFPYAAVDRARGLLESARDCVLPMAETGNTKALARVQRDVLVAVNLLSRATNADMLFHAEMSQAISHALDAVGALAKSRTVLKHVDNGLAEQYRRDALLQAYRHLDNAWASSLAGTHP